MALLDQLTRRESDRLWAGLIQARRAVANEVGELARCGRATRDELYGPDILAAMVGVLDWLDDVLETDLQLGPATGRLALVTPTQPEV